MAAIDEDVTRHIEVTPYHPGVRALTDHNAARIALLEIAQARIDAKLEAILDAIEKNHR